MELSHLKYHHVQYVLKTVMQCRGSVLQHGMLFSKALRALLTVVILQHYFFLYQAAVLELAVVIRKVMLLNSIILHLCTDSVLSDVADAVIGGTIGSVLFFCIVAFITTAVVIYLFLKWRTKKRSRLMDIFPTYIYAKQCFYTCFMLLRAFHFFLFLYRPGRSGIDLMEISSKLGTDMEKNIYS